MGRQVAAGRAGEVEPSFPRRHVGDNRSSRRDRTPGDWAVQTMTKWGLANVKQEPWAFGRGWSLERFSAHMIEPTVQPLIGYPFMQERLEYNSGTHHSNMDVVDRVQRDDMVQMATVVAWFAYSAAQRDGLLPRKPMPAARVAQ